MKLLVAEDEPNVLEMYKILLQSEGHQVVLTRDGEECINAYEAMVDAKNPGNPACDLLILDHRMPKKTGLQVANEVRGICPCQAILMTTTHAGLPELSEAAERFNVMQKPFDIANLIALLRQLAKKLA